MMTKECKPDLNALNCVSLYKHEACEAPSKPFVSKRAKMPKPTHRSRTEGLLGLKRKVTAAPWMTKRKAKSSGRSIRAIDLVVAFGFLLVFSAGASFAIILALN